jgi:hypothetical protein
MIFYLPLPVLSSFQSSETTVVVHTLRMREIDLCDASIRIEHDAVICSLEMSGIRQNQQIDVAHAGVPVQTDTTYVSTPPQNRYAALTP